MNRVVINVAIAMFIKAGFTQATVTCSVKQYLVLKYAKATLQCVE